MRRAVYLPSLSAQAHATGARARGTAVATRAPAAPAAFLPAAAAAHPGDAVGFIARARAAAAPRPGTQPLQVVLGNGVQQVPRLLGRVHGRRRGEPRLLFNYRSAENGVWDDRQLFRAVGRTYEPVYPEAGRDGLVIEL